MKKLVLLLLCLVFVLSGCEQLQKAESYYPDTKEDVYLKTVYKYCFDDESNILCTWVNESDKEYMFQDPFELHILDEGEWYLVKGDADVVFNTNYCHGIKPNSEGNHRYELSIYTDKLKSGETYRISTYFYDEEGNYFQAFAEFTCDSKLAEKEMSEVTGGSASDRTDPETGNSSLEVLPGKKD